MFPEPSIPTSDPVLGPEATEGARPSSFGNSDHRVLWGDALDQLRANVPDASADLVFVDPPYNIGKVFSTNRDSWPSEESYIAWCGEWVSACVRKLKPRGSMYVMCSTQSFAHVDLLLRRFLTVLSRIVWQYDSSGVQARSYFGSLWEPIFHCVKDPKSYAFNVDEILVEARTGAVRQLIDYRKPTPTPYATTKVPGNVWNIPRVRYRMPEYENHPSQKPEALMERIILASSNPGDLVLDPFSGTFTTAAVAQRLGRRTLSIEQEEEYVKIGLRRLGLQSEFLGEKLAPVSKTFAASGSKDRLAQSCLPLEMPGS
ncbi:MAG: adenine-specific DNA-methyltransferase [Fimbriimonadaceae bacterium]